MRKQTQAIRKLDKYLAYVLGHQPDEFGLLPDAKGFVKVKELLQALNEEREWRHLRLAHLNELKISGMGASVEIQGHFIRARDHSRMPAISAPASLPKLLYTAIRQKAYPAALAKGLKAPADQKIVLASQHEMAKRLGLRRDNEPVIITVQAAICQNAGVRFQQFGQILYLCDFIPAGVFSGPPLPKEKSHPTRPAPSADLPPDGPIYKQGPKTPGSYFPDLQVQGKPKHGGPERKRRREIDWKKERRRARRDKHDQRNP